MGNATSGYDPFSPDLSGCCASRNDQRMQSSDDDRRRSERAAALKQNRRVWWETSDDEAWKSSDIGETVFAHSSLLGAAGGMEEPEIPAGPLFSPTDRRGVNNSLSVPTSAFTSTTGEDASKHGPRPFDRDSDGCCRRFQGDALCRLCKRHAADATGSSISSAPPATRQRLNHSSMPCLRRNNEMDEWAGTCRGAPRQLVVDERPLQSLSILFPELVMSHVRHFDKAICCVQTD